jgi:hypothetical protein
MAFSSAVVVGNAAHNDPVGNAKTPGHANESTAFGMAYSLAGHSTSLRWRIRTMALRLPTRSLRAACRWPAVGYRRATPRRATGIRSPSWMSRRPSTGGRLTLSVRASGNRVDDLWTVPNSLTPVELKPIRGPGPLLLLAGKAYAYAEIQIGGDPAKRVGKTGNATLMALEPRASARYSGYRDLPSTLPPPSESNISGLQPYARLSPSADRGENED